jgi:DNA modification methylase
MPTDPSLQHNQRLTITYVPIDGIKSNPRDPRIYQRAEKRRIAKALKKFGPLPLIVDASLQALSGNIWLEASNMAGFIEVPVIVAHHLNTAEAEAFMLAQVRLIENGKWDERLLGEVLRDLTLQDLDLDLTITGFDPPEIDLLILKLDQQDAGSDPADELAPSGPRVSRLDDLWILGPHRLLCGNALDARSYRTLLLEESAHIIFADVPFNVAIEDNVSGKGVITHPNFAMASGEMSEDEFIQFLTTALTLMAANSVEGSLHYIAIDWRHLYEMQMAGRQAYDSLQNLCVWSKDKGGMGSLYRSQHELFFVFKKGKKQHCNNVQLGRFGRNRTNIWNYPGVNTFGRGSDEGNLLHLHPTVKPVALIADVLLDASHRGDIVLDPFMGSGSTIVAAEKVGRRARGIEIDPGYVDVAIRRWERWTGQKAVLEGDGRTFAQVAAERLQEADNDH